MLVLFCGLLIGVVTVMAVYNITRAMQWELQDRIDEFDANAVIMPRSEGVELDYGEAHASKIVFEMASLRESDIALIHTIPEASNLNIISPKIVDAVVAAGQPALLVGVDTQKEFSMKPWFRIQEQMELAYGEKVADLALLRLPEQSVILGNTAARVLGKEAGELISINDTLFTVFAVLEESGTEEDGLIIAELAAAQSLLNRQGELSLIEISAYCRECPIEEIVAQIEHVLPHTRPLALRQAALIREETISRFGAFGFALSGVVLVVGGLMVLTTMLNAVKDRTREIGIFRALGFRRSHIMQIILLEAGLIGLAAGISGFIGGTMMARVAGPFLAQMQVTIPWDWSLLVPAIGLSLLLALAGSIYPALQSAKLDPADALRSIE